MDNLKTIGTIIGLPLSIGHSSIASTNGFKAIFESYLIP
jgi:hypothetical protein